MRRLNEMEEEALDVMPKRVACKDVGACQYGACICAEDLETMQTRGDAVL